MEFLFKPLVLITGFGPFVDHPVNASWEAVKLMNKDEIESKHNIELVQLELPVTYENVDEFVPALWATHEPKLVIHVGVSNIAKCMTLEQLAHRKGYQKRDYLEKCPPNHVCTAEGAMRIRTKLNVQDICDKFNVENPEGETSATPSLDAGRYLCEYIYYTSLSVDNSRTLFVHVPDLNVYSSAQTAQALEKILELCLEQVMESEVTTNVTNRLETTSLEDED